jgi:hypothetical protein
MDEFFRVKKKRRIPLSLIWTPILLAIGVILIILFVATNQNWFDKAPLEDFDKMTVSDGFHEITLPSGSYFSISYETNHDRPFPGLVRHTNMDHEQKFPILSFDILVTSGDYSDPNLVDASVNDHHFAWMSKKDGKLQGTINLLHTVPMNQDIEEKLMQVQEGDTVIITGWDILRIDSYESNGKYNGYWQDSGCNTLLVTDVYIEPTKK